MSTRTHITGGRNRTAIIYNRLAGLANTGQQTSNQLAQQPKNYASQYGQNIGQAANARASAYAAKAGANQNMLSDLMGLGVDVLLQQKIGGRKWLSI